MVAAKKLRMTAPAAGGAFVPTDIAGLVGWWDASDTGTISDTSGLVDTWADKSSSGNDATGVTTTRPTTNATTQNGLNVIDSISNNWLTLGTNITVGTSNPCTVFAVTKKNAVTSNNVFMGGTIEMAYSTASASGTPNFTIGSNSFGPSTTYGVATLITGTHTGGTTASLQTRVNGTAGTAVNASVARVITHLCGRGTAGFSLAGWSAEFLIYDSLLSGTDIDDVETYLNDKWAVY